MIDWSEEWKRYHETLPWTQKLKTKGITSEEFWDSHQFGDRIDEYNRIAGYPGRILDRMQKFADPNSSVLDIGAGSGAYTIPLAKVARSVTVVEPSHGQIARLKKRAGQEELDNIEIINKRWQDVERAELGNYSMVNAAYCFHMPDIRLALQKMLDVTSGAIFLVSSVDSGFKDIYNHVLGEKESDPEHVYLYGVLTQMGYVPNVDIITRNFQIPLEMQMEIFRNNYNITPELEQRLLSWMKSSGRLVEQDGETWLKRRVKEAQIWYQKS